MPEPSNEVKQLIDEMFKQSHRAAAVVAAAVLDQLLKRCLQAFLREDAKGLFGAYKPLSSLKAKSDVAYALGILSEDEFVDIDIIRDIRNTFAHDFAIGTFSSEQIVQRCKKLRGFAKTNPPPGIEISFLDQFRFCTTLLAYRLDYLSTVMPRLTTLYTPPP
jgi:DNA-binding MltR family transcriptional regulator